MADDIYTTITSDDPRTGAPTFEQLQARRKIAIALATRNRGFPKTIGEGLTYLGESLGDNLMDQRSAAAEAAYQRGTDAQVKRLSGADAGATAAPAAPVATAPQAAPNTGPMSVYDPVGGGTADASDTTVSPTMAQAPPDTSLILSARAKNQPTAPVQASPQLPWTQIPQQSQMSVDELKQRYARNESGGEKDPYRAIGKDVSRSGDRGYGKYMVMGENVPVWSKQYLGREMTPQEFLLDPKAQEDIASARGGEYLDKYGPNGAAAAWFGGENGMQDASRPNLQAHVANYVQKFNAPLVSRDQVAASAVTPGGDRPIQLASLGGMPTSDTAPDTAAPDTAPGRDAVAQSVLAQQGVAPQQQQPQPPLQVAQAAPQQQTPIGRPPPTPPPEVIPRNAPAAPQGPPAMPAQEPMTKQEMDIRRTIGATTDPNFKGRLQPLADRLEEERKFKDAQNMEQWKKDVGAYEKRTDPAQLLQIQKGQEEQAQRARELQQDQLRGGIPKETIYKGIADEWKNVAPIRDSSIAINNIEALLDKGMFTGTLSKAELAAAKLKAAVGFPLDPRVANTEAFTAAVKPLTAAARQALVGGNNISDADLNASEAAVGGNISLTEQGMRQIMKSLRIIQLQTAMVHQKSLEDASLGDTNAERILNSMYGLPLQNIIPKDHPAVQRLMQNADNEHERGLFNSAFHTPGLAEKIILRNRPQQ